MKLQAPSSLPCRQAGKLQALIIYCGLLTMVCGLIGCDAFARKFTRKPKKDAQAPEMVLQPEEYKVQMSKEQLYRQYYLFWESWHDELVNSLTYQLSQKKKFSCASEALKNLQYLKPMLNPNKQKALKVYIDRLYELSQDINSDIYGINNFNQRVVAERLRSDIHRNFVYSAIAKDLL